MKRYAWILLLSLFFVGCDDFIIDFDPPVKCPDGRCPAPVETENPYRFRPPVDLPVELRERNWGGGSCVHAATIYCFRQQNEFEWADWWRANYRGGESFMGLCAKAEVNELPWGGVNNGDVGFLEWASRTRRGATIFYKTNHAIFFSGFVAKEDGVRYALVVDNNRPDYDEYIPYDQFVRSWRGYGGVAFTPVFTPTPPLPWI